MEIKLSDHFTYQRIMRFVMPSIAMMIFSSIYSVVDGFFVANYVGKTPFAALNLIFPFIMILSSQGFMFGAGGTALVSKYLGQQKEEKANRTFSLIVYASIVVATITAVLGIIYTPEISLLLGADENMLPYCVMYGRIILSFLPFFSLQMEMQSFFVAAGKPNMGFRMTVLAGIANIVGDFVLVGYLNLGLMGAAFATAGSQFIGGTYSLFSFINPKDSNLSLGKTAFDLDDLIKTVSNGISELLSNISMSLVSMLYNWQLLKYAGENGVAAYGAIMYLDFIFYAFFIGYSMGMAPIVSYNYGAQNHEELHSVYTKSLLINLLSGIAMVSFAEMMAKPLSMIFTSYDAQLMEMTIHGFRIYSLAFIVGGFSIFGSSFFTALNNGKISAAISFIRALVFETSTVLILPLFLKLDGIWFAIVTARILALGLTFYFLARNKKTYHY